MPPLASPRPRRFFCWRMLARAGLCLTMAYAAVVAALLAWEDRLVFHPVPASQRWADPPPSRAAHDVVPFSQGEKLYAAANEPKRFLAVKGARHGNCVTGSFFAALRRFLRIKGRTANNLSHSRRPKAHFAAARPLPPTAERLGGTARAKSPRSSGTLRA